MLPKFKNKKLDHLRLQRIGGLMQSNIYWGTEKRQYNTWPELTTKFIFSTEFTYSFLQIEL